MMRSLACSFLIIFFISIFARNPLVIAGYSESLLTTPESTSETSVTRVLVDKSQMGPLAEVWAPDGTSEFGAFLRDYNISVETNTDKTVVYNATSIDPASQVDLADYDILILAFPQKTLPAAYIADALDFVYDGGGLLLGGISNKTQQWGSSPLFLNSLAESFGVAFNSRILSTGSDRFGINSIQYSSAFGAHEIWNGVESIAFEGCSLNITGTEANATSTFNATKYGEIWNTTAVANYGSGRVFFTGAYHKPFGTLYFPALVNPDKDHWQFVLNAMNWLAQNPHQTAQQKYPYKIFLQDGPDMNQDELAAYNLYVGSVHVHTTASDGYVEPNDRIDQAEAIDLDFLIMSDHIYGIQQAVDWNTLATGAFAMKTRAEQRGYHVVCHVGGEVSAGWAHIFTFPYTDADEGRLPRTDTTDHFAEDIATIRSDHDLFVAWAHPQLLSSSLEKPVLQKIQDGELPIEAMEITNYDICASLQLRYPFIGTSDAHSYYALNRTLSYVFAKSTSESDLMDAFRNRRVVVLNKFSDNYFNNDPYQLVADYVGDQVWVDELFMRIEESRATLSGVQAEIDTRLAEGEDVTDALAKMSLAGRAFNQLSPGKAKNIAESIELVVPTIDQPADITYEEGASGNIITWTPDDTNPATYTIYRNGTSIETGNWDGSSISINIDGLAVGTYNFTLVVSDTSNISKTDTVMATVTEKTSEDSPGFSVLILLLGFSFGFLMKYRKRRRKSN
ncbi:MAG: hypothetical protein ACXACI_02235 [Candidatus Hodarchaeales archaeon]